MITAVFIGGPRDSRVWILPDALPVVEVVSRFHPYRIADRSLTEPQVTIGQTTRYYRETNARFSRVCYAYRWEHLDQYEMLKALLEWYAFKAELDPRKTEFDTVSNSPPP